MTFLTLNHISHHFFLKNSYTKALNDISLSVKEGEFISILGPSGCGKSTILSIIADIISPTEGEVLLNGKRMNESSLSVGYMLQQDYLFPWKTIIDNVLLGPRINKRNINRAKKEGEQLLRQVGLANVTTDYPSSLSGGMRQRAALVRTLINSPEILLLD